MAPAPLELGGYGGERLGDSRPTSAVDTLMRALLYLAQQAGRPVSEADVRRLCALPDGDLDEPAFVAAATRLGLRAIGYDLRQARPEELPLPFAVCSADGRAEVVLRQRGGLWSVLDVAEARVRQVTAEQLAALGVRALALRELVGQDAPQQWFVPFWRRVRPVIAKLAAASFLINVLGLATPLFMMLVLNRVIGHGTAEGVASLMAVLALGMLLAYALDFGLRVLRGWLSARTGARLDVLLSAEVVHHLMQLPYRHFERTPSGVIAERLRQLDVLRGFLTGQMPALAIDLCFVALFLAATFAVSTTLGAITVLAGPLLIAVSLAGHRAQRRLADENFQALAAKSSTLAETVTNA
ncbi:MAG TPA: ABC transporter transmembrane domain-containing protein, partial [Reyranella sp.]|nr:ABC transporter transmembrane domain-containing protein [Reyranella sp.]